MKTRAALNKRRQLRLLAPEVLESRLMLDAEQRIEGTAGDDVIRIEMGISGQQIVAYINDLPKVYQLPEVRLTIDGLGGRDRVVLGPDAAAALDLNLGGIALHVLAEEVTVRRTPDLGASATTVQTETLEFSGTDFNDHYVFSQLVADQIRVQRSSDNNTASGLYTITSGTIIVNGGTGDDTAIFEGPINLGAVGISVQAEEITVRENTILTATGGITLTARGEDGGESVAENLPASVLRAKRSLIVEPGASLQGGEIALKATRISSLISPYINVGGGEKAATISIEGAILNGTDITIETNTEDKNLWDEAPAWASNYLINPIKSFIFDGILPAIPVGVIVRRGLSAVSITDASITASGSVSINAISSADAATWALGLNHDKLEKTAFTKAINSLAVGYSEANSASTVDILGTTTIVAAGNVDIGATTGTIADITSAVRPNSGSPADGKSANSKAFALSIGISRGELTATTYLGPESAVTADGNVNISSEGSASSWAASGVKIFVDGTGGASVALSMNNANVTTIVDGRVTSTTGASTTVAVPVNSILNDSKTFFVPGHGFEDCESIVYYSQSEEYDDSATSPDESQNYKDIGGLVNGLTYRVIVVDEDHFQLARSSALALDARGVSPESTQTLAKGEVATINLQSDVNLSDDTLTISNPYLREGTLVSYGVADSADVPPIAIGGLLDGTVYRAINVTQLGNSRTRFQLARIGNDNAIDLTSAGMGDSHLIAFTREGADRVSFRPNSLVNGIPVVDRVSGKITVPGHGLQTGDAVTYDVDSNNSTRVLAPRSILIHDRAPLIVDASDIDIDENTISPLAGHDLVTGQRVHYVATGQPIAGLVSSTDYFVIRAGNEQFFRLATTRENAEAGIAIDFTSSGGTHSFTSWLLESSTLTLANHGLETGQKVMYRAGNGPASMGLDDGASYYVIRLDDHRLKLASTLSAALAGNSISLLLSLQGNEFEGLEVDTAFQNFQAASSSAVVDANNDTLTIPGHGLQSGFTVIYRGSGTTVAGLADDTRYVVHVVDANRIRLLNAAGNAINLGQPEQFGNGLHGLDIVYPDVDLNTDRIYITDHGLNDGDIVKYRATGSAIGGLTDNTDYEVLRIDGYTLQLTTVGGTQPINLSGGASADSSHRLIPENGPALRFVPNIFAPAAPRERLLFDADAVPAVNSATDTLTIALHNFVTGDEVVYLHDGNAVGGLTAGATYRVRVVDANQIQLLNPATDQVINLSEGATGQRHGLLRKSMVTKTDTSIAGLKSGNVYYVVKHDNDTFSLATSPGEAAGSLPLTLDKSTVEKPGQEIHIFERDSVAGIGITATLYADSGVQSGSQVGGYPMFTDLLFDGAYQSPFSAIEPSSWRHPDGSVQKGIAEGNGKDVLRGASGNPNDTFSVAASLGIAISDNNVLAKIGGQSVLTSAMDVVIDAMLEQYITARVDGVVSSDDGGMASPDRSYRTSDNEKKLAVGAAINVGLYGNAARAIVESGAVINANNDVAVHSAVVYPLLIDPISLGPFSGYYNPRLTDPRDVNFLSELKELMEGDLGLDRIVNVWVNTKTNGQGTADGSAAKVSIAGSIAVTDYRNVSEAIIESGVLINRNVAALDAQSLDVTAELTMELISVAGMFHLNLSKDGIQDAHLARSKGQPFISNIFTLYGNSAGQVGVGASVLTQAFTNTTRAVIEDGAYIQVGAGQPLNVNAVENIYTFEFVQAGGKSGNLGISGSISVVDQQSETLARIAPAATIVAGSLNVNADNHTSHTNLVGAIQLAQAIGIGASAGLQFIERNTQSVIGSQVANFDGQAGRDGKRLRLLPHGLKTGDRVQFEIEDGPSAGQLSDGGYYFVHAVDDTQIKLYATRAAAIAGGDDALSLDSLDNDGQYRLTKAADIFVNVMFAAAQVQSDSRIYIPGHDFVTGDVIDYRSTVDAIGGLVRGQSYHVTRVDANHIRLALTATAAERREYAKLSASPIHVPIHELIRVGNLRSFDRTAVVNSQINLRGHRLETGNLIKTGQPLGGLPLGDYYVIRTGFHTFRLASTLANAQAGIALTLNPGLETGPYWIEHVFSGQAMEFQVAGKNDGNIVTVGVAAAIAAKSQNSTQSPQNAAQDVNRGQAGQLAGNNTTAKSSGVSIAGNATWHTLTDTTLAKFNAGGRMSVTSLADTTIQAANDTSVYAIAGAIALAKSDQTAVAVAGAFSRNLMELVTHATVEQVILTTPGDTYINASRDGEIVAVTVGAAGSQISGAAASAKKRGVAIGGSVTWNTIDSSTESLVQDASLTVGRSLYMHAYDRSKITAVGGGFALSLGGQLGLGAGVVVNTIDTQVLTRIENSNSTIDKDLHLFATNESSIFGLAVSAGIGQLGVSGTFSINSIQPRTLAEVRNANLMGVDAMYVVATDKSEVSGDAGGVAVGLQKASAGDQNGAIAGALGVAVAINDIGTAEEMGTYARIIDSQLNQAQSVTLQAVSSATIKSLSLAGAVALAKESGSQGGATALAGAGAGSQNIVATNLEAIFEGSSVSSSNSLSVSATDNSRIHADAGGFNISGALSSGSQKATAVGIGIGVAVNDLLGQTLAIVDRSTLTSVFAVNVSAVAAPTDDQPTIAALAMGGGLSAAIGQGSGQSGAFQGAGAITRNRISRDLEARLSNSLVAQAQSVSVIARDDSIIEADSGGVSIAIGISTGQGMSASASIGVSVSRNMIGDFGDGGGNVTASLINSSLTNINTLTVRAESHAVIDALSISGTIAVSASTSGSAISGSGAGADAQNEIRQRIIAESVNSTVVTTGDISITANEDSFIKSVVVGASVDVSAAPSGSGLNVAIGASVSNNTLANMVDAIVRGGSLNAGRSLVVTSTSLATDRAQLSDFLTNTERAQLTAAAGPVTELQNVTTLAQMLQGLSATLSDNSETHFDENLFDSRLFEPMSLNILRQRFEAVGINLSERVHVEAIEDDTVWQVVDAAKARVYHLVIGSHGIIIRNVNVQSIAAAASVSVGVSNKGVTLSGGGAASRNTILTQTHALVEEAQVTSSLQLRVNAMRTSSIASTVVAVSVTVGIGVGGASGAASIGAAVSRNDVGYDLTGNRLPAAVEAKVIGGSVNVAGNLIVNANSSQSISTVVVAASVAVSASTGGLGVGLGGAGASAINRIAADASAVVESDGSIGKVKAGAVSITARDDSLIRATAGGVAVAVAASADNAVAISIGVGLARNTVTSEVTAHLTDVHSSSAANHFGFIDVLAVSDARIESVAFAGSLAIGGATAVGIGVSGAGAEATNLIGTHTVALVSDSLLRSNSRLNVRSDNNSEVLSKVVSVAIGGGFSPSVGIGASIGAGLARNIIGQNIDDAVVADFTTAANPAQINRGQKVRIESGLRGGDVYEYIGDKPLERSSFFDSEETRNFKWLTMIDYGRESQWKLINLKSMPSRVEAALDNVTGVIQDSINVTATSRQTIESVVAAGAAGISGAGAVAASLSGAGVGAYNFISTDILASIRGRGSSTTLLGKSVEVLASDISHIDALAGAASLAAAFSPVVGVSLSIGVSIARNEIKNSVTATVTDSVVNAFSGQLKVRAVEASSIDAVSFAASLAVGGGMAGIALSGAGADSINTINNRVDASLIRQSVNATEVSVLAENTSNITSNVYAIAAAVSGGAIAGAGSIGVSIARNFIGTESLNGPRGLSSTRAYIQDSNVVSAQDTVISARSAETVRTNSVAGSAAIAVGIGLALAGAGAESTTIIAGLTEALVDSSNVRSSLGNIDVTASAESKILESKAVGASLAASVVGASIAATIVRNELANTVRATIQSNSSRGARAWFGDIRVSASTVGSEIADIQATNAAIAVGLVAISGGGVDIHNTVNNIVTASTSGPLTLTAGGEISLLATDEVEVSAGATGVSTAVGLGAAAGVALVRNEIFSTITASARGLLAYSPTFTINASSDSQILNTRSVGVGIGLVGALENIATSIIASAVIATVQDSTISADNDFSLTAESSNTARTNADGGAGGGVAQGAMIARTTLGRPGTAPEVLASLGNNTSIFANRVTVVSTGQDDLRADSVAGGGGAIAAIGAQSTLKSDQQVTAEVGNNVLVEAQDFVLKSFHSQLVQTTADAHAFALGTGAGAGVETELTGGARTAVGQNSRIDATSIRILADNVVDKPHLLTSHLHTGSFGFFSTNAVHAITHVGTSARPLAATIDIAPGATLQSSDSQTGLNRIHLGAVNDLSAFDSATIEGGAGFATTTATTKVEVNSRAVVNLNRADLSVSRGPVYIFANDTVRANADAGAFVVQGAGGAGAEPNATINSLNAVNISGGSISADEVIVVAGRELIDGSAPSVALPAGESIDTGVNRTLPSQLESTASTDISAFSLGPNIIVGKSAATVNWINLIDIQGNAIVEALRDVSLTAEQMDGLPPIAEAGGFVLNTGGTPYGYNVKGDREVQGTGMVNIGLNARIRGGANSQAAMIIRPISVNGFNPANYDQPVSASDLAQYGLNPDLDFRYRKLDISAIPVKVTAGTVVQVVSGAAAGGQVGRFYRWRSIDPQSILLDQENYGNSQRWELLTTPPDERRFAVYPSSVGRDLAAELNNKFYVLANKDLPLVSLTVENLGNRLLEEKNQILSWMLSHAGNSEALARYQSQLDAVLEQIKELGVVHTVQFLDDNETLQSTEVVGGRLDAFFLNLPAVSVTPGRVLIEATPTADQQAIIQNAISRRSLIASAKSSIQIDNQSPFMMVTRDAIVDSNRRIGIIDGRTFELAPGDVFLNFVPQLQGNAFDAVVDIKSRRLSAAAYDLDLPDLPPQDLYIAGDVINTAGNVSIRNPDGSIIVSGEIRAAHVDIQSGRDFNLNTDGFFHTNRDPRQYLNLQQYADLRQRAQNQGGVAYPAASDFQELQNAIEHSQSQILARGDINVTARYLNINGLIQSGIVEHTLLVDSTFTSPITTDSFLQPNSNHPLPGISFGNSLIPMNGYFDADRGAIVVSEIESTGGNVRLTGKLFSTGNGRVVAAHGMPTITIDNNSQYDLVIEGIDATASRIGKVTLVDSDLLVKTEYIFNGTGIEVKDYQGQVANLQIDGTQITGIAYTPVGTRVDANTSNALFYPGVKRQTAAALAPSGLRYVWVDGFDSTELVKTRYERVGFNLFGIGNNVSDSLVADPDVVITSETVPVGVATDLERSEYVATVGLPALAASNFFSIGYMRHTASGEPFKSPLEVDVNGWLRKYSMTMTITQIHGHRDYFTYSLAADRPVAISFQQAIGQPNVNISSEKDLLLEGNVTTTLDHKVDFFSRQGSVLGGQFVGVYGALPTIVADQDIDLRLEGSSQQQLYATANKGDIRLEAISPTNSPADFNLYRVRALLGDVLLVATGSIFSTATQADSKVIGRHIELVAETGAIYGVDPTTALRLSAGAGSNDGLSAYAFGVIKVEQFGADLRLAKPANYPTYINYQAAVHSKNDAVTIRVEGGNVVDGWQEPAGQFTEEQLAYFDNFFQLTGQAAEDAIAEAIRNEETSRTARYHQYWVQERQATRAGVAATMQISSIANNIVTTSTAHGLKTGESIYLQKGFEKTGLNFASAQWQVAHDKSLDSGPQVIDRFEVVRLVDGRLFTFVGLSADTIDPLTEDFANSARWAPVAVKYNLADPALERLVLNPGDVVRTATSAFRYMAAAPAQVSMPTDVALYVIVVNANQFRIATTQTSARLGQSVEVAVTQGGAFDSLTLVKYNYATNAYSSVDVAALPQPILAVHQSLDATAVYDVGYTATLSPDEVQAIRDARYIDADRIKFPVTAVVLRELYPETSFGTSVVFPPLSNELLNVLGTDVQIFAERQIGKIGAATSINLSNGFSSLSDAEKLIVSGSSVEEIVGRYYATYVAVKAMDAVDLRDTDFSNTQLWQRLNFNYRTSQLTLVPLRLGQIVLVERPGEYGLYRLVGGFVLPVTNLNAERFQNNTARWQKINIDFDSTDGVQNIAAGKIVQDYSQLLRATFQPQDDINVRATTSFSALGFGAVAIESDRAIHLDGIYGDDIRISTPEEITTTAAATGIGVLVSDGTVYLRARSVTALDGGPMKVQLGPNATLGGAVSRDFKIQQLEEDLSFLTINDLTISTIESNGLVYLEAMEGSIRLGQIATTGDVHLVAHRGSILDVLEVGDSENEDVNITAHNARLEALGIGKFEGNKRLGISLTGALTAHSQSIVYIDSPRSLIIDSATANYLEFLVNGDLGVGQLTGEAGVFIEAEDGVIYDATAEIGVAGIDTVPNIVTPAFVLRGNSIGSPGNFLEVDTFDSLVFGEALTVAEANNSIYLAELTGDLRLYRLQSLTGDVTLNVDGSIIGRPHFDSDTGAPENLIGDLVTVVSESGAIGSVSTPIRTQAQRLIASTQGGNAPQVWHETDRVTAVDLNAGSSSVTLSSGEFLAELIHSDTDVLSDALLGGNGTVLGTVRSQSGTIAPGLSPGVLTTGSMSGRSGYFRFELSGPTPGIGLGYYDQLIVAGSVFVGNSVLDVSLLNNYRPRRIDRFILIDNDGDDPVNATFAGLPEGASIDLGDVVFAISYVGGDGNDVELRVLSTPENPPRVMSVWVDSSMWSGDFRDYADGTFTDPSALGFRIPSGIQQLSTLPWVNIDRLKIAFSSDVGASLDASDFILQPTKELVALGIPPRDLPTIIGVDFDSTNFIATVRLSHSFFAAAVELTIQADGVYDTDSVRLDGEWTNAVSDRSGDGASGGDFVFHFLVLPGDAVDSAAGSGTRAVNSQDSQAVRDRQNGLAIRGAGAFNYDVRSDFDGNNFINAADSQAVRDQQNAIIYEKGNAKPGRNHTQPTDTSRDGITTPLDALLIINALNGLHANSGWDFPFADSIDVSGDGVVTPLDALLVINELNARGEGESAGASSQAANTALASNADYSPPAAAFDPHNSMRQSHWIDVEEVRRRMRGLSLLELLNDLDW